MSRYQQLVEGLFWCRKIIRLIMVINIKKKIKKILSFYNLNILRLKRLIFKDKYIPTEVHYSSSLNLNDLKLVKPGTFSYGINDKKLGYYTAKYEIGNESYGYYELSNVQVYGYNQFLILLDYLCLTHAQIGQKHNNNIGFISNLTSGLIRQRSELEDTTFLLLNNVYYNNYYHWIFDSLSKLIYFDESFRNEFTLLLPCDASRFVFRSVELLGLSYRTISKDELILIKNAVVPELPSPIGQPNKETINFIRNLFSNYLLNDHSDKKYYISRKNSKHRRISNEKDLVDLLDSYGFVTLYLEEIGIDEQINLFSVASFIVAPHGAGLTNITFSKSGTKILELFPESYEEGCYESISKILGHNYTKLKFKTLNQFHLFEVDLRLIENHIIESIRT
jgi:hypothetical protein